MSNPSSSPALSLAGTASKYRKNWKMQPLRPSPRKGALPSELSVAGKILAKVPLTRQQPLYLCVPYINITFTGMHAFIDCCFVCLQFRRLHVPASVRQNVNYTQSQFIPWHTDQKDTVRCASVRQNLNNYTQSQFIPWHTDQKDSVRCANELLVLSVQCKIIVRFCARHNLPYTCVLCNTLNHMYLITIH